MNSSLLVLVFAAMVIADDDIDWSTVKGIDIRLPAPYHLNQPISNPRIVGGNEVVPHSIPYQAGLLITKSDGTYFCGGSLISVNYVLTAAHCMEGSTQVQVRLGAHRILDNESTQQRITSTTYTIHAAWNRTTLVNDIAVVRLPNPAVLNDYVKLITLPRYSDVGNSFSSNTGRISGWGVDSDQATTISEVLREVLAGIITNLACNVSFLGFIKPSHICTSGSGFRGPCGGDSGGPLVTLNRQVGIVSFGLGMGCEIGWPSAYTRVTSFLNWIAANTDVIIQN